MNLAKQIDASLKLAKTGQKSYDSHVKCFEAWLENKKQKIGKDSIASFLLELAETKSAGTVSAYKQAVKKSLSMGIRTFGERAVLDALFAGYKIAKADKKVCPEKLICKKDSQAVLQHLDLRHRLVYKTLAQTGLRISELVNIKHEDCRPAKGAVSVRVTGKGKKERRVFIDAALFRQIQTLSKSKNFLFSGALGGRLYRNNVHVKLSEAGRLAGVALSAHKLRHTFATNHIKAKGSVKAVSLYLGHASPSTTESMYNHDQLTSKEALRFAV